jgi:tetratricopeptide (TPR) repeat protein
MKPGAGAARFTPLALAVFGVALALRALHLWQLRASPFLAARIGDAAAYDAWAREIAAGDWLGREVFYQAPLYPYFLGALYASLGDDPLLVRGVQSALGALSCALLASAGARLFSPAAGLAAGLLLATYAPAVFLDALLQKSVLDGLGICLALWLAARLGHAPRLRLAAALGLATGALVLSRENALVLAGVLAAWLLTLPGLARRRRLALAGLFGAGLLAALLPVALRNRQVGGELHLTTSQLGPNLYIGNHPGATGSYAPLRPGRGSAKYERQDATELAERALGRPLSPGEVSDWWTRRALDYALAQPGDWLYGMAKKLALLLDSVELVDSEDQYTTAEYSAVLRATGWLGHFGVLAPLALLGACVSWPRRRELWWLYASIAAYAASVLLFYVFARYRYPLVPFLALLAGAGIAGAQGWARARSRGELAACAGVVLALAFASNRPGIPKASMRAVTHFNLGNVYKVDGDPELAARHYREALALEPHYAEARHNLADTLAGLGRSQEAIAAYEQNLLENPRDALAHNNLAVVFQARGERERALVHYRRAVELDPDYADARRNLADLELALAAARAASGDEAGALEHYESALALRPDALTALRGAAWILATHPDPGLRRPVAAVELAERAAELSHRTSPSVLDALATAYAADGRFELAAAVLREALELHAAAGSPVPRGLVRRLALFERGLPFVRRALARPTGSSPDRGE